MSILPLPEQIPRSRYFYSLGLIAAKYQPHTISLHEACEIVLNYCYWLSFIEYLWILEVLKVSKPLQGYHDELSIQIDRIWEYRACVERKKQREKRQQKKKRISTS